MVNFAAKFLLTLARWIKRGGVIINEHSLSKAQTESHVRILDRWFDFIGLEELSHRLAQRTGRPFCLLTFDDGKRSNFSETAPVLRRLRVPAVFYVTTEALTTGSCLWFDQRDQLVRQLGYCPRGLELDTLKELPFDRLRERLERASAEHHFVPVAEGDEVRPMSWEEARILRRWGFTIGAHGVTHSILTREPPERALAEIEESMAKVTRELGEPCQTFAFPNGNYTVELAQHAARCGARTVMTTDPMWVDDKAILWRLPRIQLFGEGAPARLEAKIALAAFKGALVNPNGSGRSYRTAHCGRGTHSTATPVCSANR
ncbi:MAG TPA: polysaccharide deacetylase family protein [Verrucomicrobiae bacterium]|nr:polysaccharide deacetylase family protein [Verrucomicrobiae bacterium]